SKIKSVFESFPALIDYRVYSLEQNNFILGIADQAALKRNNLEQEQLEEKILSVIPQIRALPILQDQAFYLYSKNPIVTLISRIDQNRAQIIHIGLADLLTRRTDSIQTMIIGPKGEELSSQHFSGGNLFEIAQSNFLSKNIKQGVVEKRFGDQEFLL